MTSKNASEMLQSLLQQIDDISLELQTMRSTVEALIATGEDVIVSNEKSSAEKRSVIDVLSEAPGHRGFKSAAAVDKYLASERASWD